MRLLATYLYYISIDYIMLKIVRRSVCSFQGLVKEFRKHFPTTPCDELCLFLLLTLFIIHSYTVDHVEHERAES